MLDDPKHTVCEAAFSVAPFRQGFLLREDDWSYIQYGEDASKGIELFDVRKDPKQYTNLAKDTAYEKVVKRFKNQMALKLREVRDNDLN